MITRMDKDMLRKEVHMSSKTQPEHLYIMLTILREKAFKQLQSYGLKKIYRVNPNHSNVILRFYWGKISDDDPIIIAGYDCYTKRAGEWCTQLYSQMQYIEFERHSHPICYGGIQTNVDTDFFDIYLWI